MKVRLKIWLDPKNWEIKFLDRNKKISVNRHLLLPSEFSIKDLETHGLT